MMDFGKKKSAAQIAAEKEKEDLSKAYLGWRREQREALLNGPHGEKAKKLVHWCTRMSLTDAPEMISRVRAAMVWAEDLEPADRVTLLRMLNNAIVSLRERNGLPPFDDGLPDEEPKAYHQLKSLLGAR